MSDNLFAWCDRIEFMSDTDGDADRDGLDKDEWDQDRDNNLNFYDASNTLIPSRKFV